MRSGKFGIGALLASSALIGPMTAAERSRGRYMRAPDGHGSGDAEFDAFAGDSEVEVGESNKGVDTPVEKPKRGGGSGKPPRTATKPGIEETKSGEEVDDAGETDSEKAAREEREAAAAEGDDEDEDGEEGEEKPKPKKKASDRIRELTRRDREKDRTIAALTGRLDAIEKGGLPANNGGGKTPDIGEAPDPTDGAKYPLGHLDERYIEDKLEWLATSKAATSADAVLQRQQETERAAEATRQHEALLGKVDDLTTRGSEVHEDYEEAVLASGLRGEWRLDQPTFEAAHEAEHGAQILYDLSQDKKEAARVAALSPFLQVKYIVEKDAEIASKSKPRTKPGAGAPPSTTTRGANSRTSIKPDTDNLNDFEKAWAADAKK